MAGQAELLVLLKARDEASAKLRGVGQETQSLQSKLTTFATRGTLALGAVTAGAIALKSGFVDAASDLNEARNAMLAVFGDSSRAVEKFAETSADAYAISNRAAFEHTAQLGAIFKATGLNEQAAADMSVRMVQLAGDLASFKNLETDVALEKIRSGLVGQAEPLQQVGVLLSAAAVKQEAYTSGIAAQGAELTEAQKVQARFNIILEQTADAHGDAAKTADDLAGQERRLASRFEELRAEIGTRLLPVTIEFFDTMHDGIDVLDDVGRSLAFVNDKARGVGVGLGSFSDILPPQIRVLGKMDEVFRGDASAMAEVAVEMSNFGPASRVVRRAASALGLELGGRADSLDAKYEAVRAAHGEFIRVVQDGPRHLGDMGDAVGDQSELLDELRKKADDTRDSLFKMFTEPTLEEAQASLAVTNLELELAELERKGDDVTAAEKRRADNIRDNLLPAAKEEERIIGLTKDQYQGYIEVQQGGFPTLGEWKVKIGEQRDALQQTNTELDTANRDRLPTLLERVRAQIDFFRDWREAAFGVRDALRDINATPPPAPAPPPSATPTPPPPGFGGPGNQRPGSTFGTAGAAGTAGSPAVVNQITISVHADSEIGEQQMRKLAQIVKDEQNNALRLTGLHGSFLPGGSFSPT